MTFLHKLAKRVSANGCGVPDNSRRARQLLSGPSLRRTPSWFPIVGRPPVLIIAVFTSVVAACSGPGTTGPQGDFASIHVWPKSLELRPGDRAQMAAYGFRTETDSFPATDVTWSASGGTISEAGEFTAGDDAGTYRIAATHPQRLWITDTSSVAILPSLEVVGIVLRPQDPTVSVGDSIEFSVVALMSSGDTGSVTTTIQWTAESGSIRGNGQGKGLYKGSKPGKYRVNASTDSLADSTVVTVVDTIVALVEVSPAAATTSVGQAVQLSAILRDVSGNEMIGKRVTWSTSAAGIAAVSDSGLVTALDAGTAVITATSEGQSGTANVTVTTPPPPPPPAGGVADPTALPVLAELTLDVAGYAALNMLGMAGGTSFVDPSSGRWVLKVTAPEAPSGSTRCKPSYSAGGPYVSLPWGAAGTQRTVLVVCATSGSNEHWLVDVDLAKIGTGQSATSNYRLAPITTRELTGAFSRNPATPQILYYRSAADSKVHRYNTATNADADASPFPLSAPTGNYAWLTIGGTDAFLSVIQDGVLHVVDMSSGAVTTITRSGGGTFNEGHIDPDGRYVWGDYDGSDDGEIYDRLDGWGSTGATGNVTTHTAISGKYVMFHDDRNGGLSAYDAEAKATLQSYPTSSFADNPYLKYGGHIGGQWGADFGNSTDTGRWFLYSHDGGGTSSGRQGQLSFINPAGDVPRVAAFSYANFSIKYQYQTHASLSADGKVVLWNSNMGQAKDTGRHDTFLTVIPTQ